MFIADALSKFAADLTYESVPPAVRGRAKHLLLDAIGIAFASGKYEFSRRALSGIRHFGEGGTDVIGLDALAQKVGYEIDPHSGYPKFRSGEVIVTMEGGRELRQRENILPDEPAADEAIVAKFMDNARMVMPESRAAEIRDMILAIDTEPNALRISRALGGFEGVSPRT